MKKTILVLSAIAAVAFFIRVYPHFNQVFTADGVFFMDTDCWYHLRMAEYTAAHYPQVMTWDYYAEYPTGAAPYFRPLLSYLIATIGMIAGLGHPSAGLLHTIGAWLPPVFFLAVIPLVYWLAVLVFKNQFVGYLGAALAAVMPSELLHRSVLGFTDQHILEVIFGLLIIISLVKLEQTKKYIWLLLLGGSLGLMLLTWTGAIIWVGIVVLWLAVSFIIFRPKLFLPIFAFLGIGTFLILFFIFPAAFEAVVRQLKFGIGTEIAEWQPMTVPGMINYFGLACLFALAGLYYAVKDRLSVAFLTFTVFWVVYMGFAQRWTYYTTIPISLLAASGIYRLAGHFNKVNSAIVTAVLLVALSLINNNIFLAKLGPLPITSNWYKASVWLKENTPEPVVGDRAEYSVLTWWNYGNFISCIGHRVPLTNSDMDVYELNSRRPSYKFLVAQTDAEAEQYIAGLNVRYVIIDNAMADYSFQSIVRLALNTGDWQPLQAESEVYRMYNNDVTPYFTLIHREGDVKIFERNQ